MPGSTGAKRTPPYASHGRTPPRSLAYKPPKIVISRTSIEDAKIAKFVEVSIRYKHYFTSYLIKTLSDIFLIFVDNDIAA